MKNGVCATTLKAGQLRHPLRGIGAALHRVMSYPCAGGRSQMQMRDRERLKAKTRLNKGRQEQGVFNVRERYGSTLGSVESIPQRSESHPSLEEGLLRIRICARQ